MLTKKKKILILSFMVVLLVATGVLNLILTQNATSQAGSDDDTNIQSDFFVAYRADRASTRIQSIAYLDAIIASETATEADIQAANTQKMAITTYMEQELVLEGLIKSHGFQDCVVTLSTENVNVIVKSEEELLEEQVAQILYTIVSETKKSPTQIKVIPV